MDLDRHLDWDGCYNVRDLGGLRAAGGFTTRRGALVRADTLDRLTSAGWSALAAHGIRTIVDLRGEGERQSDVLRHPPGVDVLHVPLEDPADTEFWAYWGKGLHGTPLYYRAFLDRFPRRCAAVVAAVADARPGGVVVHCAAGRDRTGLVVMLLLALIGVAPDDIAADYGLSAGRLRPLFAALNQADFDITVRELVASRGTTVRAVIAETVKSLDVEAYLGAAGLGPGDFAAVRARFLTPAAPDGGDRPPS